MAASHIFRIMFVNQGKVYEVYAKRVGHGNMFGFVEVEEMVFGERSGVVLDPAEERIRGAAMTASLAWLRSAEQRQAFLQVLKEPNAEIVDEA